MNQVTDSFWSYISKWTISPSSVLNVTSGSAAESLKLDVIVDHFTNFSSLLSHHLLLLYQHVLNLDYNQALESFFELISWLDFTDFQLKLLKEFSLILLGNVILVLIAWQIYGGRISSKFAVKRGSSRRAIEELRLSMSELQLPKEHDFKFK